jgi:hypothetical protein
VVRAGAGRQARHGSRAPAPDPARPAHGGGGHRPPRRDLYDQLWDQPPPQATRGQRISAAKARAHAARHHWPPPLAWDDDTIDQPGTQPARWQRTRTHRSRDLAAEAAELTTWGYTRTQAAQRLGVSRGALDKAISRATHPRTPGKAASQGTRSRARKERAA